MNGRSRTITAVLLSLFAASFVLPSSSRVVGDPTDPTIGDAGGGFKNATWDFTTPGAYRAVNVSVAAGNASLNRSNEWNNYTSDVEFLAAKDSTDRVVINSGLHLEGSTANLIADGTFTLDPGPWNYTNGTSGNVSAERDGTAQGEIRHDSARIQFDSTDDCCTLPTPNWTGVGTGTSGRSQESTIHVEGSGSLKDDVTFVVPGDWAGVMRNDAGTWNWSGYNRLAVWIEGTAAVGVQVYIHLENPVGANPWDYSPPFTLTSGWRRYVFDYSTFAGDASAIDRLDLRFTGPAGSNTTYLDDIVLFSHSAFNESAKVSQNFTKPSTTSDNPGAVVLTFDVDASPSVNVVSTLRVSVAGVLAWTDNDVDVGLRSIYVDLSANMPLQGSGMFALEFELRLARTGTEEASMIVWIDNVNLTATDYQNGSFTSRGWTPGSTAIWKTTSIAGDTPPATSVVVETRTGFTPTLGDTTWSNWANVSGGIIESPPGSHIQWRLLLDTANGSETPVVATLEIVFERYAPSGSVETTTPFDPTDLIGWRRFEASDVRPPGTSVDYNVSVGGSPWTPVVNGSNLSGMAASALAVRFSLSTSNTSLTPTVTQFLIRYEYRGNLSRIVVTPATVTLTADETQQFTATGYDAFNHTVPNIFCSWSAGAGDLTNVLARTVTYEPTIPGVWPVRCEVGSVSGNANVTVLRGALANIVVLPNPGWVNVTDSITFSAAGEDADGNAVPLTDTTWTTTVGQISSAPAPGTQATLQAPATEGTGTITARDGSATGSATVLVLRLNAPTINGSIPDDTRLEDSPPWPMELTTFAENQRDPDDTLANLRWTMDGLDGDVVTVFGLGDFNRHTLWVTPVPDAVGTDEVAICLEDVGGARGCQAVNFTLTWVNDPPRWLRRVEPIHILVGESYTFEFLTYVKDDNASNELSLESNDPNHIRTRGLSATFTYGQEAVGTPLFIELTVRDGWGATASTIVVVYVTGNPPPRCVFPPPSIEIDEDTALANALGASLEAFCADPASEPLTFSAYNFTNVAVWVNDTGAYVNVDVAGMPNFCGGDRITFRASDPSGAYAEVSIRVTVRCVNDAPVLSWTQDIHVRFDSRYRLDLRAFAFDVDSALDGLTLTTNDTQRASADGFTVSFLYLWAPAPHDVPVTLTLSDGLATDSQSIVVHVGGNAPPELIKPLLSVRFDEDEVFREAVNLPLHFDDLEDGNNLVFTIASVHVNAMISPSHLVTLTPAGDWFGQETLVIRATDTGGAFAMATLLVDVLPVNDAPEFLRPIPPQEHLGGRAWILDLRDYVTDVDDDLSELSFTTDSSNVRAVGSFLLFDFPFADRSFDLRVTAFDGNLSSSSVLRVVVQGAGFWGAIFWPWSGFAVLALVALSYVAYLRWSDRRFSFEDLFVVGSEGRLIMHTTRRLRADRDEDLLAGMLTAIVMFVRDSFKEENEELKKFEFGERTVAVEKSDHVYGAAIFARPVPAGMYLSLRHFLADMEDRYNDQLQRWSGDISDLPGLKDMMEYFGRRGRYRVGDWKRFAN